MSKKNDLTYIGIIEVLERIKFNYPYLRIGQIISNATHAKDCYYVNDQELLEGIEAFENTLAKD